MSELMTRIMLRDYPDGNAGWMDWGRRTREEMLNAIREKAAHDKEVAEAVLAASDDDFDCAIVRGPIVQKLVEEL